MEMAKYNLSVYYPFSSYRFFYTSNSTNPWCPTRQWIIYHRIVEVIYIAIIGCNTKYIRWYSLHKYTFGQFSIERIIIMVVWFSPFLVHTEKSTKYYTLYSGSLCIVPLCISRLEPYVFTQQHTILVSWDICCVLCIHADDHPPDICIMYNREFG